jgi:hypothetical protein
VLLSLRPIVPIRRPDYAAGGGDTGISGEPAGTIARPIVTSRARAA